MSLILGILLFLASSGYCLDTQTTDDITENFDTFEPVFIAELWKYGAKVARDSLFPSDYEEELGLGSLQPNGMRTQYVLGEKVRSLWKDNIFLPPVKNNEFQILSTEEEKTIQSAYSHALGLFPFGTGFNLTGTDIDPSIVLPEYVGINNQSIIEDFGGKALPHGFRPVPVLVVEEKVDFFFMRRIELKCPGVAKIFK